jgi:hypothetical protein
MLKSHYSVNLSAFFIRFLNFGGTKRMVDYGSAFSAVASTERILRLVMLTIRD